jgi:hypothetical protein
MPLKNLNELPAGGWCFDQKDQSGKVVKSNWVHRHSPFQDFCMEVLRMREANKYDRATLPQVREEVDEFQCQRLGYDPRFVKKKPVSFQPTRLFSPQHLRERVQVAASRITDLSNGAHIITRWFGSGATPAANDVAQRRADICNTVASGASCPFNAPGFAPVERIAEIIKAQVEKKNELKLEVKGEENLHTCSLCFCHLPTKIWTPIEHIISGTPAPMIKKFRREQPQCWIVKELDEKNKTQQ